MDTGDQSSYVEHTSLVLKDLQVVETVEQDVTCQPVAVLGRCYEDMGNHCCSVGEGVVKRI